MSEITCIRVRGDDLAPGDVVGGGNGEPFEIVSIQAPVILPGWGRVRTGLIRWTQRGTTQVYTFRHFSLKDFEIVGGSKLEAARQNPALVRKAALNWIWVGGA